MVLAALVEAAVLPHQPDRGGESTTVDPNVLLDKLAWMTGDAKSEGNKDR
jgi:hypothetical protein